MDWFDTFRYDYPKAFGWTVGVAGTLFVFTAFMSLPESPLLQATGVTGLQKRISALNHAVYWQVRASTNSAQQELKPVVVFGNILGIDAAKMLIISIPSGNQYVQTRVSVADTQITDLYGAAAMIGALRTENAKFEVYPGNQAVIWFRNVPFNVKLIEAGYAIPDPNPPTNIVDVAFATYYWGNFRGGSKE